MLNAPYRYKYIHSVHKKNTGKKKGIDRGINIFVAHLYINFLLGYKLLQQYLYCNQKPEILCVAVTLIYTDNDKLCLVMYPERNKHIGKLFRRHFLRNLKFPFLWLNISRINELFHLKTRTI